MRKRLYKSEENRVICGVCGGLADFFGIDPTIVRLIWAVLTVFAGAGVWLYIIAAIIIPREPL
ncbi:MAG: PspC domain-containing protein [Clostridiales bacterium]|nr:PspC domain-containing protein [Clostridiales bacterium]